MRKRTPVLTLLLALVCCQSFLLSGRSDAACPLGSGNTVVDWIPGSVLTSIPFGYGIDIAGSTTGQDSYHIVFSAGDVEPYDQYPFVYSRLYDTESHSLLIWTTSNACTLPYCFRFRTPSTDNTNLLGIVGGWVDSWVAHVQSAGYHTGFERYFASDLSPVTPEELATFYDYHQGMSDVAGLPGTLRSVIVFSPDENSGHVMMRFIEMDGLPGNWSQVTTSRSYYYRTPAVASSVVNDTIRIVAVWSRVDYKTSYFRVFDDLGNALTQVTSVGSYVYDANVAALPDGFVISWVNDEENLQSVKFRWYDWNGNPISNVVTASLASNSYHLPAVSAALWMQPGGTLQPYYVLTFTSAVQSPGPTSITRYYRFYRGINSPVGLTTPVNYFSAVQTFSRFFAEYRNAVELFNGCYDKLVAGIVWAQSRDSDKSLFFLRRFQALTFATGAGSGYWDDSIASLQSKSSGAESEIDDTTIFSKDLGNPALDEKMYFVPDCYDYMVGSCVGQ